MKFHLCLIVGLWLNSGFALADSRPAEDDAANIRQTLTEWGCWGGTYEKEAEARPLFEIDDVKCGDGIQYDVRLDSNFQVLSISRD